MNHQRVLLFGLTVTLLGIFIIIVGVAYGAWQRDLLREDVQSLKEEVLANRAEIQEMHRLLAELGIPEPR